MSLLEQYEQEYASLIAEITLKIAYVANLQPSNGPKRGELCSKINTELSEAQDLLEQIGLEIRDLNAGQRITATNKLNCAQVELKRLQTEFRKAKEINSASELQTSLDYYDDVSIADDQRQRLLDNSERIERTGNRLTEGYRVVLETEQMGAQVLNDLHHQRETVQTARSRLRETNADLGRTSRTLNTMMLRALRQKVVLYTIGVCFVVAVGISLYLTFAPSSATES